MAVFLFSFVALCLVECSFLFVVGGGGPEAHPVRERVGGLADLQKGHFLEGRRRKGGAMGGGLDGGGALAAVGEAN